MTQSQRTFIALIKMVINDEKIDDIDGIDWHEIYRLSCLHNVVPIIYYAIQKGNLHVPNEYLEIIQQHFFTCITQLYNQKYYAEILFKELDKKGIRYMPLKGYVIRKIYPEEEMRTSCDIDIFYDKERATDVSEIMKSIGFQFHEKGENHDAYICSNTTIELHHDLIPPNDFLNEYYENIWDSLEHKSGSRYQFSVEDHYIYLLLHFVKHFLSGGGGIRSIADIYLYRKAYSNLNEEYLDAGLEKLGILRFKNMLEKVASAIFGKDDFDDETYTIADYIINGSTYGSANIGVSIKHHSNILLFSKVKYILYRAFPPLAKMRTMYKILNNKAYLLPVLWVVRWFEVLFYRRNRIKRVVDIMNSTSHDISLFKVLDLVGLRDKTGKYF